MARDANGANLLLGKGKLYFNLLVNDVPIGERFLGNCDSMELTTEDELKEKFSSADASSPKLASVNVRRTQSFSIKLSEFTKENIALALMGTDSVLAVTGATITDEAVGNVKPGYWYPLLHRKIYDVVVTKGATTYVEDEDYAVDQRSGRVYIIETGDIVDGDDLTIDYKYDADTSPIIRSGISNVIEGALRFIGDPAHGPELEVLVWKVSMNPDGAIGLISDDYADFGLKGEVLADSVNHPNEPYFLVIDNSAAWTEPGA